MDIITKRIPNPYNPTPPAVSVSHTILKNQSSVLEGQSLFENYISPIKHRAKDFQKTPNDYFSSQGKILLTGEYLVCHGALALSLPTQQGQLLSVSYRNHFLNKEPILRWITYDHLGNKWFEATFELWHFQLLHSTHFSNPYNPSCPHALENVSQKHSPYREAPEFILGELLRTIRRHNIHFLREDCEVIAESFIQFPFYYGLGSSSTFLVNLARFGRCSPYELQKVFSPHSSGIDIAAAQSHSPILYFRSHQCPTWSPTHFQPPFLNQLYLLYTGSKVSTQIALEKFQSQDTHIAGKSLNQWSEEITKITQSVVACAKRGDLDQFCRDLLLHENILSKILNHPPANEFYQCSDFPGVIKSLGTWGGDFLLIVDKENWGIQKLQNYFLKKSLTESHEYREIFPLSQFIL